MIAVTVDPKDTADVINKYAKEGGFTFPLVSNGADKDNIAKAYGVRATPTNIVLDENGVVVSRYVGFQPDALKADLAKLGVKDDSSGGGQAAKSGGGK